jgi:hypothetical protein
VPVEMFTDGLEPTDTEAVIWRFMQFWKFQDLISTGELYFRRADLLDDHEEGIPPEDYMHVLHLNRFDVQDVMTKNHFIGSMAQDREGFFINCWHLFSEETAGMWKEYGDEGVAVVSRYSLLKMALQNCDGRPHLGLVRYGSKHLTGWNTQRFITTKRERFAHEREVRALLWVPDEFAGNNRHFDDNDIPHPRPLTLPCDRVPEGHRRKVDLNSLMTEIVVSPWASEETLLKAAQLTRKAGYSTPARWSELRKFRALLP